MKISMDEGKLILEYVMLQQSSQVNDYDMIQFIQVHASPSLCTDNLIIVSTHSCVPNHEPENL